MTSIIKQSIYKVIAVVSLGLAILGAVLPGLPTTEFVLLCAWSSAKGSPRIHRFLMSRQFSRELILNWEHGKVVSRTNKIMATLAMLVCAVILLTHDVHIAITVFAITGMLGSNIWIWSRPEQRIEKANCQSHSH